MCDYHKNWPHICFIVVCSFLQPGAVACCLSEISDSSSSTLRNH